MSFWEKNKGVSKVKNASPNKCSKCLWFPRHTHDAPNVGLNRHRYHLELWMKTGNLPTVGCRTAKLVHPKDLVHPIHNLIRSPELAAGILIIKYNV